jgi:hypothetical protein
LQVRVLPGSPIFWTNCLEQNQLALFWSSPQALHRHIWENKGNITQSWAPHRNFRIFGRSLLTC